MINVELSTYCKLCCQFEYGGIAFDNNYIYVTSPKCYEIERYNKDLKLINKISVNKAYTLLCYDNYYNCFWATTDKDKNKIYKLDNYFNVLSVITLKFKDCRYFKINRISCYEKCKLKICFEFGIVYISKEDKDICLYNDYIERIGYFEKIHLEDCTINLENINDKKWKILNSYNKETICHIPISSDYIILDIAFSNGLCEKCKYIYILAKKECSGYCIIKIEICEKSCCLDSCNCCKLEEKCSCDNYSHSVTQIIKSIALMEASLSHILNAEGEKIQKILCTTDKTCDIIKVNESVNKTIINVSHLEQILYSKLLLTKEIQCCDDYCEDNCLCEKNFDVCSNIDSKIKKDCNEYIKNVFKNDNCIF